MKATRMQKSPSHRHVQAYLAVIRAEARRSSVGAGMGRREKVIRYFGDRSWRLTPDEQGGLPA